MSRFPLLPLAMVAASVFLTCRTATEISVVVTTDFPCAALRHVHVTVGTLGDALERKPSTSTHASCKDGYAGTLVVVPSGANNDEVGFKIVAGITSKDAEECSPSADSPPRYGAGCIVARRALRYLPHTALTLPVTLRSTCEAVTCGVTDTCVNGACVAARITDSSSCAGGGGCSETTLGSGRDGGVDAAPDGGSDIAATCGDMRGLQAGAAWPMSGYCPTRRGRSPYRGAQTSGVRWQFAAEPATDFAVAADGTVYASAFDGSLYAYDSSGTNKWTFPTVIGAGISGGIAIGADGTVYFCAGDNTLYALKPDGKMMWSYPTAGDISAPTIGGDGTVYFSSRERILHAVDTSGKKRWELSVGSSDLSGQPVLSLDGGTIYVANNDGQLYAVSAAGAPLWSFASGASLAKDPAVGADGTIYFGAADRTIYALTSAGKKKWATVLGEAVRSGPSIGADGRVYVPTGDGRLTAVDKDGQVVWSYPTGRSAVSSAALGADGIAYFIAGDGAGGDVIAVDASGKLKWQTPDNAHQSPAIGADGSLYVGFAAFGP